MSALLTAVLMFVYVVAAVAVIYRVVSMWFADGNGFNAAHQLANALNALVLFAALMILHAAAAYYGVAPALKLP